MFGALFRRQKKKPSTTASSSLGDSIKEASVGDVFTVTGLSMEYDESYFIIEKMNRYESSSGGWHELLGVDGDNRLWVQWSDQGGLFVTANAEGRPMGLSQLGVTEDELIRMDEEQSIDRYITCEGTQYYYRSSGEAFFFQDGRGEGEGYYLWEFVAEDKVLAIDKWEGMPFQGYVSDVVSPDDIALYKR